MLRVINPEAATIVHETDLYLSFTCICEHGGPGVDPGFNSMQGADLTKTSTGGGQ